MPPTCVACGARQDVARFERETFTVDQAGLAASLEGLSGWRCGDCGEVQFDADSAQRYAAVGDEMVLRDRACSDF